MCRVKNVVGPPIHNLLSKNLKFFYITFRTIPHGNRLHLQLFTDGCVGSRDSNVRYLEHVQAIVTLNAPKRGDIQIYLTSPQGNFIK